MSEFHSPDAVRLAIRRRFLKFGASVDQAMVIVQGVLEERDAEISRLRDELAMTTAQVHHASN